MRARVLVRPQARALLQAGSHLAVLSSLAFAQPLFDLLRRNAEFFAIRGSEPVDIVVFAVAVVLVPPLVLLLVEAVAATIGARVRRAVHLVFVSAFVAVIALELLKRVGLHSSGLLIPLSVLIGGAAAWVYARARAARVFLDVLSPAPPLFLVLFLFFSPVTKLITGSGTEVRAASSEGRSPIVMIVFDELPVTSLLQADGRIDAVRYPSFSALARGAYWFRNAASVDAFTQIAVPAILTGRLPGRGELPTVEDHPDNLFTLLGGGYRLHVSEAITRLCPRDLCRRSEPGFGGRMSSLASDLGVVSLHLILPDDLRRDLPSIDSGWQNFRGGPDLAQQDPKRKLTPSQQDQAIQAPRRTLIDRFVGRLGSGDPASRPPLDFIHLLLPHVPWQYLPDGSTYGQGDEILGLQDQVWADDRGAVLTGYQRHLLQLGFADRELGVVLRRLRSTDAYDKSLIVVVADHGVSFRPGQPRRNLTRINAPDLFPVPLFIKAPGQRAGKTLGTHVQTIDVLPTMAALLKIRLPWRVDGRSAFASGADRKSVSMTAGGDHPVRLGSSALDALRAAALERKIARFGAGDQLPGLYGVGPHPELVGRRVATFARVDARGAEATLDNAGAFSAVDLGSGFAPVYLVGHMRAPNVRDVAIAVNGTIGAVTTVLRRTGTPDFSAVVPPRLLHDGSNRVEVFALSRSGGRMALSSLWRTSDAAGQFRVEGDVLRAPGGKPFRIVPGAIAGAVDRSIESEGIVALSGWAADARTFRPAERVLGFVDGHLRFSGRPSGPRPDIARAHQVPPDGLAFDVELPRQQIGKGREPVDVFALRGGVASRLPWFCSPEARQDVGC